MHSILIERRRTDRPQFTSCQGGLEQIARTDGAFRLAGADDGVEFVDEEDDPALAGTDFTQARP